MVSELFTGEKITVGPPFYNRVTGPQFAGLVLLMGIAPLVAWRRASARQLGRMLLVPAAFALVLLAVLAVLGIRSVGALIGLGVSALVVATTVLEFWRGTRARMRSTGESPLTALLTLVGRNRRRYGGYIIHLAVVLMTIGIVGSNFYQKETQGLLRPGEQLTLGRYVVTYDGLDEFFANDGRQVARASVSVYRDGRFVGQLHPRRDFYIEAQQPMTIPGVRSTIEDDLYVLLVTWEPIASNGATFKVYVNPLVNWIWAGGLVFILGTLVAAWPDPAEDRRRVLAGAPARA
jgi:cytochrome c-type biogenesis protein CcmF